MQTNKQTKKLTKKQQIINQTKQILSQYSSKITLRQLYYRLVALQIIENKTSQYKYLSRILVDARKSGLIDPELFEDRTREFHTNQYFYETPEEAIEWNINRLKETANDYKLPHNFRQEHVSVIMLEKQALEGVFAPICRRLESYFIVDRGYNSYTQLREFANELSKEKRKLHLYIFSDYDPSGLDIQRNFIKQLQELGVQFESITRVALTPEQIKQYSLPPAPPKKSDTRSKSWTGGGVVELDALEPRILEKLIEDSINEYFDFKLYSEVKKLEKIEKERLQKKIDEIIKLLKL